MYDLKDAVKCQESVVGLQHRFAPLKKQSCAADCDVKVLPRKNKRGRSAVLSRNSEDDQISSGRGLASPWPVLRWGQNPRHRIDKAGESPIRTVAVPDDEWAVGLSVCVCVLWDWSIGF